MSRHRSFTSVQTVHTHTRMHRNMGKARMTHWSIWMVCRKNSTYMYTGIHEASWKRTDTFRDTLSHKQYHMGTPLIASATCADPCHGWSWGFAVVHPPHSATDFKVLQSAWNLPSEVATPHFLDCISSNAYTNIETQVCDPVLGTLRINFQIWFPEAKQQLPKHRTYYIIEGSLEVKLPTIWTDEKQRWEESERREE